MAVLINGNGNEAIYAQQDADWFASIMGNQTAITAIGSKFAATLEDANTIGVADGVIITQEGRRIQLDVNELDLFDIPAGGQGETNYYIIGYHLITGDLSEQYCETFVRLMDNATDTIPEDTFRSGADEVFVSLYRITQDNLAITDMELLLPEITTVAQISSNLTANNNQYKATYQNGKYGFMVGNEFLEIGGGGMPILDYANPVKTFTPNDSFTVSEECYLHIATMMGTGSGTAEISIDGTPVSLYYRQSGGSGFTGTIKLKAGQVVTTNADFNISKAYILNEA